MAFTSYLVQKFETFHENEFFRKFSQNLEKHFADISGEHILIGNVSVQGRPLDAIFLCKGQITIIDFKDYGGLLHFVENNQWRMTSIDGKSNFVQVRGGGGRNPFNQLKTYRFSLMPFLSDAATKILTKNHTDIKWDHIGTMVLFHRTVEFSLKTLDEGVKRWFRISDASRVIDDLSDIYSNKLEFNDIELRAIVSVLGIDDSQLLSSHKWNESLEVKKEKKVDPSKLTLIKKLIDGSRDESLYKKAVGFYQTMVNVERFKEPHASNVFTYPLDLSSNLSSYQLDVTSSEAFHQVYLANFNQQYPKNLFVALLISMDGKTYPLLYDIIMASDIKGRELISFDINGFGLYAKILEEMGQNEDVTDELTIAVNDATGLEAKVDVLKNYLGESVSLTDSLQVGLSTESLFTIQVASELRKLKSVSEAKVKNTVFESFVLNGPVDKNAIASLPLAPYIVGP